MMKSPLFYIGIGVLGTWAFHKWVKPLPTGASGPAGS
jgi:hypothetical protein